MIFAKNLKVYILFSAVIILLSSSTFVSAATFNLSLNANSVKIGDTFNASIKIDSEGASINTAQATLIYPSGNLSIESIDKTNSVFNFWLAEPTFSNTDGKLSFTAGSGSGFTGPSLQVLNVKFKAKGNGTANITFNDAAITLSDGSGTNVLSDAKGASITISPQGSVSSSTNIVAAPVQIERAAVPSAKSPVAPVVTIPLYPDPEKWYNLSSVFSASWVLPADVTAVATLVDKDPRGVPTNSEGLFDNKSFAPLDNGVWYLHVRFKNNIGWGPTTHYRIAVDTNPPASFDVKSSEGTTTDNPTPTLTYAGGDPLSGIGQYSIRVDGGDYVNTEKDIYALPALPPGDHVIRVNAKDLAGNITEGVLNIKTLPIESPKIFSVTSDVFIGEGGISINGSALPNISLILNAKNTKNDLIYTATTNSDASGNWVAKLDQPLKKGIYYIEVISRDARGALSLPVVSDKISVRSRPLMIIFGLEITSAYFAVLLAIILVLGFAGGMYYNRLGNVKRSNRSLITERDVVASFGIVKKDIDKALEAWRDNDVKGNEVVELKFLLEKANENLEKMQKYVIKGIRDINK